MIPGLSTWIGSDRRFFRSWEIVALGLCMYLGHASLPVQAAAPATPDEINNIRVYKHIARSTVLIASAYTGRHHATQASWKGLGSGVLIDDRGSIVTNSHVVDGTAKITVTLHDGKQLPAELVGSDPQTDVALIRVALPKGSAVPAQLGNSDKLEIGQKVLAIGHPFGLGFAFSTGIISGFGKLKDTEQESFQHSVQTTAPINPGNSGGPLIDSDGRVIGINATIMMEAQNISFAIPINTVKSIVAELRINGHIIRPWLGVKGKFVTDELRNLIALPLVEGLLVLDVEDNSPAEKTGLRAGNLNVVIEGEPWVLGGDIIIAINEQPVRTNEQFRKVFHQLKAEQSVDLTIMREGEFSMRTVTLEERPSPLIPALHSNLDRSQLVLQGMGYVPF